MENRISYEDCFADDALVQGIIKVLYEASCLSLAIRNNRQEYGILLKEDTSPVTGILLEIF